MNGNHKRCVVFLTDKLGYHYGGCTTVNYEMCIAMRQNTFNNTIVASISCRCNPEERVEHLENALNELGVKMYFPSLISQVDVANSEWKRLNNGEIADILSFVQRISDNAEDIIWVGHDIFTGHFAVQLASTTQNGRSAVFIHTDYDTVEGLKGVNNDGVLKEAKQRKIIKSADLVFAIGPRLMRRVKEIRSEGVFELIPGSFYCKRNELYNDRAIVSYGRFDGNAKYVKQTQLVLAAFGLAVRMMNNNKDYVLHIIGSPDENENRRLRNIAEKYAGRKVSIHFLDYTQDRQLLYEIIQNNCAGLMVSISEGFGLTGWEMISMGMPLILTRNSGLYDYLDDKLGYTLNGYCLPVDLKGSSSGDVCEEDVRTVAEKIVTVFKQPYRLREAAEKLQEMIVYDATWTSAVAAFANALGFESSEYDVDDIYSETYKERWEIFEDILNKLELDEAGEKEVIFFGGISSSLCSDRSISKLSRWLQRDSGRRLFICYEAGEAAAMRASELDRDKIPSDGMPLDPYERMNRKAELVESSRFKYSEQIRDQIRFIKLEKSPLAYTILVDDDVYFTVVLHERSSNSMTMMLRQDAYDKKKSLYESMEFILEKDSSGNPDIDELMSLLKEKVTFGGG